MLDGGCRTVQQAEGGGLGSRRGLAAEEMWIRGDEDAVLLMRLSAAVCVRTRCCPPSLFAAAHICFSALPLSPM